LGPFTRSSLTRESDQRNSAGEATQEITATKSFDVRSAVWLMKELFPSSATITGISGVHTVNRQSMQSDRRGSIYARRLLTESITGDEISDQRILRLLRDAETDDRGQFDGVLTFPKIALPRFGGAFSSRINSRRLKDPRPRSPAPAAPRRGISGHLPWPYKIARTAINNAISTTQESTESPATTSTDSLLGRRLSQSVIRGSRTSRSSAE